MTKEVPVERLCVRRFVAGAVASVVVAACLPLGAALALEPVAPGVDVAGEPAGGESRAAASPPSDPDVMPDGLLKHCVTRTWNPDARPATFANTKTVTSATLSATCIEDASEAVVADWTGAEFLPGLVTLTVTGVADVAFPAGGLGALLPQLRTANLTNGGMTAVPVLGELPELTTLNLSGNQLASVSGLTGMPKLATLNLNNNALTALSALGGLPALATLNATNNQLTQFPALGPMPALATLNLTGNQLTAISGPTDLPALATLTLTGNQLTSVTALAGLGALRTLTLTGNQLASVDALGRVPMLANLGLNDNAFTAVPAGLDLPELTQLHLNGNAITVLAVPDRVAVPKLATLNLNTNQIGEVAGSFALVPGLTVNAGSQSLGPTEEISAVQPHPLDDLLTLPASFPEVPWTAGADNMAAVNPITRNYAAARAGAWSVRWSIAFGTAAVDGRLTYNGTVTGTAVTSDALEVSFEPPGLTREGDDAVYRATVAGLDPSTFAYQWYRGTTVNNTVPVPGETGETFTIPAVGRADNGAFVKVVVVTDGGEFQTTPAQLAVQPEIADPGLAACLDAVFDGAYSMADLLNVPSLDCSRRGIASLVDVPLIRDNALLDLSGNEIADLGPLVKADGTVLRRGTTDLSDNLISDVTPLGRSTVSFRLGLIVLDGNRISDVSALALAGEGPRVVTNTSVSIRRQRVGVPPVAVETDLALPAALSTAGAAAPLHRDGTELTGPTVRFSDPGLHELTWDVPVSAETKGVHFGGAFVVPVGLGTSLRLTPEAPVGGHPVSLRAVGFVPGELVTFTWEDGTTLLSSRADAGGMVEWSFLAPYVDAEKVLTAEGANGAEAGATVRITDDEVVEMPDAALRACVNAAIHLPADSVTYRTRVERVTGAFACRNRGVSDLTGLEHLPTPGIDLIGNVVTSLETLATLHPSTTSLDLRNNEIDRLGEPAPQPNLRQLNLSDNRLTDVTALNAGAFPATASIEAYGQTAAFPVQLLGVPGAVPVVPVSDGVVADLHYPEGIGPVDGSILWPEVGDFSVGFDHLQAADASADPPRPQLRLTGTIMVMVVDRGEPRVMVNPETVYPTQMVNVLATGFTPGERAIVTLHSDPILLGSPSADGLGMVRLDEVVIPREIPPGDHTLRVEGVDSGTIRSTALTVLPYPTVEVVGEAPEEPVPAAPVPPVPDTGPAPVPGPGATPPPAPAGWGAPRGNGGGALPATGAGALDGLVAIALVAILAGLGATALGRRRRGSGSTARRWRLWGASCALALLVGAAGVAPASAQAADLDWRPGWCHRDEGMALVIDFRLAQRESWPPGNHLGYDVRCITGPGLDGLQSRVGLFPHDVPALVGVPVSFDGGLRLYWGIRGGSSGMEGTISGGWGTSLPGSSNVNRFVGLNLSVGATGSPVAVPQFLPDQSGGGGGGRPDMDPRPGAPSGGGTPTPDTVVVPPQPPVPPVPPTPSGGSDPQGGNDPQGTGPDQPRPSPAPSGGSRGDGPGAQTTTPSSTTTSGPEAEQPDAEEEPDDSRPPDEASPPEDGDEEAAGRVFSEGAPAAAPPGGGAGGATWPWVLLGIGVLGAVGAGLTLRLRSRRVAEDPGSGTPAL